MAANLDTLPQAKSRLDINHGLVVAARQVPPRNQITRLTGLTGLNADHHSAHIAATGTHLHREVGHVGRLGDTWHAQY